MTTTSDLKPNTNYRVSFQLGNKTHYGYAKTNDQGKMAGVRGDRMPGVHYPLAITIIHHPS